MEEKRVQFKGVGPLTRSTVGNDPVDPQEQKLTDALHWIWSWRLQVERLRESTRAQGIADTELERERTYSRASYDEHILAVAGWNLVRALKMIKKQLSGSPLDPETAEALKHLRHCYEHWDKARWAFQGCDPEKKNKSLKELEKRFPNGRPWAIVYDNSDWKLGGIVTIGSVTKALRVTEGELLKLRDARMRK